MHASVHLTGVLSREPGIAGDMVAVSKAAPGVHIGFPGSIVGSHDALDLLQAVWIRPVLWTSQLSLGCSRVLFWACLQAAIGAPVNAVLVIGPSSAVFCVPGAVGDAALL